MKAICSNFVEKPEKFKISTVFEPVNSRCRCDVLTNWAMKLRMLIGSWSFVGSYLPLMNESTNKMIYEINHILNCEYIIQVQKLWSSWTQFEQLHREARKIQNLTGFEPLTSRCRWRRCRDNAVVRTLASHQCGPGSIPDSASYVGWVCWFSSVYAVWNKWRGLCGFRRRL